VVVLRYFVAVLMLQAGVTRPANPHRQFGIGDCACGSARRPGQDHRYGTVAVRPGSFTGRSSKRGSAVNVGGSVLVVAQHLWRRAIALQIPNPSWTRCGF